MAFSEMLQRNKKTKTNAALPPKKKAILKFCKTFVILSDTIGFLVFDGNISSAHSM